MKYQFDRFTLDTDLAQLSLDGAVLAVEPRVFDLLVLLVEQRQRVVTRDEIVARLWAGRFTSDTAISTCVKSLRKILRDDGARQNYIKTVRGRGFHFIGEITGPAAIPRAIVVRNPAPAPVAATIAPGKPSIIVLPFQNLEARGLAGILPEALAHELIQTLSRLRWLRVIARGTAFQFRQTDINLRQLGEQLQLRYALSGAIESAVGRHAVTVELSDCLSEEVVWAERFDISSDQIHAMRQSIVGSIIAALEMYIPLHEANLAALKTSENLDAWANYHLGLRHMFRFTQTDNQRAAHYFERAIAQDPAFARAYAGKSFTRFQDGFLEYSGDREAARRDARHFAERGIELDPLDPFTNYNMGRSFWLEDNILGGFGWLERSISLSPNFAQGYYSCSYTEVIQGNAERALENSAQALHLSPLDPLSYGVLCVRALAFLRVNDMAQAVHWAEKSARAPGAHFLIWMVAAAIFALAGNAGQAHYWSRQVRARNPQAGLAHFFNAFPLSDPFFRDTVTKGLQLAGF